MRKLHKWQLWVEDTSHGTFQCLEDIHNYLHDSQDKMHGTLDDLGSIQIEAVFIERKNTQ